MKEAKYIFPLDDTSTVCGFEAYIGDKHVVGEVKRKEVNVGRKTFKGFLVIR